MTIIFRDVSKSFAHFTDREVEALSKVSFTVEEHKFISIVGPSGCGKTTLLKIAAGLIQPDSGQITFEGTQLHPNAVMVFQDQGLLPWRTVLDNIGLGLELQHVPRSTRNMQVLDFMKRVKLTGFEKHYPHELSGGMRQRVALARAFLSDSDILLMDEPFGALDAQIRLILQGELLDIWRSERKTVLFVTHDIDEALLLSDQVIVMTDRPGKIQEIMDITLDRPRDLTLKDNHEFIELRWKIWKLLEQEVRKELKLS